MADTPKVLGQAYPATTTLVNLYTVPNAKNAIVSSLTCCNQATTSTTIRVSVAIAGATDTAAQYIYYNQPLGIGDTFIATIGMTLAAADQLRCYSANGNVSFNLFGDEIG